MDTDLLAYSRADAEKDLNLVGFVVYESPLKGDTKQQIDYLRVADFKV